MVDCSTFYFGGEGKLTKKQAKRNRITDAVIYLAIVIPTMLYMSYLLFTSIFIDFQPLYIAVYLTAFVGFLIFFGLL